MSIIKSSTIFIFIKTMTYINNNYYQRLIRDLNSIIDELTKEVGKLNKRVSTLEDSKHYLYLTQGLHNSSPILLNNDSRDSVRIVKNGIEETLGEDIMCNFAYSGLMVYSLKDFGELNTKNFYHIVDERDNVIYALLTDIMNASGLIIYPKGTLLYEENGIVYILVDYRIPDLPIMFSTGDESKLCLRSGDIIYDYLSFLNKPVEAAPAAEEAGASTEPTYDTDISAYKYSWSPSVPLMINNKVAQLDDHGIQNGEVVKYSIVIPNDNNTLFYVTTNDMTRIGFREITI